MIIWPHKAKVMTGSYHVEASSRDSHCRSLSFDCLDRISKHMLMLRERPAFLLIAVDAIRLLTAVLL